MIIDKETSFYRNLKWTKNMHTTTADGYPVAGKCVYTMFFDRNNIPRQWAMMFYSHYGEKPPHARRMKNSILKQYQESEDYTNNPYKYKLCTVQDIMERLQKDINDTYNKK